VTEKSVKEMLECVLDGRHLSEQESVRLLKALTDPSFSPAVAGAVLAGLRAKGVVASELRGFAGAMRELARKPKVDVDLQRRAIDIVGTGGDASGSVNISTGTALLVAACGIPVIKHGNRSISSRSGSADVLEALGLSLPLDEQRAGDCLSATGFSFLFAPHYHPAMKSMAPLRRALGVRTVFNLLGPLVNPLRPDTQVLGVGAADLLDPMADALARLGLQRAVVVHGHGGLDEASLSGPSELRLVEAGRVRAETITPASVGLAEAPMQALAGGELADNQAILEAVLQGRGTAAQRDVVALNAALVLWASGRAESVAAAVPLALEAMASGAAWQRLERLRSALAAPQA